MHLKAHAFPIVRMDFDQDSPGGLDESLATFEALLARRQEFVLIGRGANRQEQDHEERKTLAIWMKRHRDSLRSYVLALVYVAPEADDRLAAEAGAATYEKFWGYPMLVTANDAEGLAMAGCLLAGESISVATRTHQQADR
ncbi:hypothetical protein [Novosphingobium terrae]|uniref:hypothetical protein n=1 Tax=Novosphingobium terrae TaxID=2726189 RepID=UPI0019826452|nr:hypothetical protein [Novosphingobium terrae]